MEVSFAFLCDYADNSGGKLATIGIGFDTIYATRVPATHPLIFAVIGLRFSMVEAGLKNVGIRAIDADGNPIVPPLDATVTVAAPPSGYTHRSQRIALAMYNITFPRYEDYSVSWLVDGREVARVPVKLAPPPQQASTT